MWGYILATWAASFGLYEGYCLYKGLPTLSEFVRDTVTPIWPGLSFGAGVAVTLLAVHFWGQLSK